MLRLSDLHDTLVEAGLPITGISASEDRTDVKINWVSDPTPEQLLQAQQILAAFDWNPPDLNVAQIVANLTTAQRQQLITLVLIAFGRQYPRLLERVANGTL